MRVVDYTITPVGRIASRLRFEWEIYDAVTGVRLAYGAEESRVDCRTAIDAIIERNNWKLEE